MTLTQVECDNVHKKSIIIMKLLDALCFPLNIEEQ